MDSNNDHSRRKILQKTAAATTAGILTSLAGCQTEGTSDQTPTPPDTDNGNQDNNEDTPEDYTVEDVTYTQFVNRALTNPNVILQEVFGRDEERQEAYNSVRTVDIMNVQSALDSLSGDNAQYLVENIIDKTPWSVFNKNLGDMRMIARDTDTTESALLDFSMEEALEGLESREDVDVIEYSIDGAEDDIIEFEGNHITEDQTEFWNTSEPQYIHGHVVPTEIGPMTNITTESSLGAIDLIENNQEVRDISLKHLELMRRNGYSILEGENNEQANIAAYILNRAEGQMDEHGVKPASDKVGIAFEPSLAVNEGVAESEHRFYQEDGYEELFFKILEDGEGYSTEPNEDRDISDSVDIEDHSEHPFHGEDAY